MDVMLGLSWMAAHPHAVRDRGLLVFPTVQGVQPWGGRCQHHSPCPRILCCHFFLFFFFLTSRNL